MQRVKRKNNQNNCESLRLSFILNYTKTKIRSLQIEVSRDNVKTIGPFLRGDKIYSKLEDCLRDEDLPLFDSLCSVGMTTLPFIVPANEFANIPLYEWASSGGRFYKRTGTFGSLKPICIEGMPFERTLPKSQGLINTSIVYVKISRTYATCYLRFRYVGIARDIGFFPSTLPIRLNSGNYILRDPAEENYFINIFREKGIEIDSKGMFSLSIPRLAELVKNPPERTVFLTAKTHSLASSNHAWTPSEIKWFGDITDVQSTDFLDAYLENRNYVIVGKDLGLFEHDAIFKRVKQDLYQDTSISDPDRHLLKRVFTIQEHLAEIKAPSTIFKPYLKKWQNDGVRWLLYMRTLETGAILADEMGLGKTIQTIAFLSVVWNDIRPTYNLIICPASVVENWKNEICRFEPKLGQYTYCYQQSLEQIRPGFTIISYERAIRQIKLLDEISFDNIVLDEAQKIKNAETVLYKTLLSLRASFRMMLTGTPIENTIIELWNHIAFINPDTSGAMKLFRSRYPILENTQKFVRFSLDLLSNFILLRKKSDVDINLPPLVETIVNCHMEASQHRLYEAIRKKFLSALKKGTSARISSLALEALLRLRQCCCLPKMLPVSLNSDLLDESCKITIAFHLILQEVKRCHKILVFSQFLDVLKKLGCMIDDIGINYYVLTGESTNRQELVDAFNSDLQPAIFLISLKAGGVGMNLATANSVILFDPWWNPAVEKQSFARAHRIGQKKTVEVFKLICNDTVEEKMMELQERKKEIAAGLSTPNKLSLDEMMALLS